MYDSSRLSVSFLWLYVENTFAVALDRLNRLWMYFSSRAASVSPVCVCRMVTQPTSRQMLLYQCRRPCTVSHSASRTLAPNGCARMSGHNHNHNHNPERRTTDAPSVMAQQDKQ